MKKDKFLTLISSIFLIFLILLPAWAEPPGKPTGELRIGVPTLLTETLHPYTAPPARKFYTELIYDYLVGIDEKMNLDPKLGVAYKWEEAPDHMSLDLLYQRGGEISRWHSCDHGGHKVFNGNGYE